jgi:hypothetical protein
MPEIVYLADPGCALKIEYPRPVMEKIRQRACDGLMALPRIGIGVGGLLLGVRENGRIRLTDSMEIPCTHSGGPSFNLTSAEKDHVRTLIAAADKPGVIGWYCSKPRGTTDLADAQTALYKELFPDPGQVALMLRPSTVEKTCAAFFFRDEKGEVVKGPECELEEWRFVDEEPEPDEQVVAVAKDEPDVTKLDVPRLPQVEFQEPEPPVVPTPARAGPDMFASYGKAPRRKGVNGWILAAAALLALGAAAHVTQDSWLPLPPLTLTSTESNGALVIRWNVDGLRGIDRASMFVNDGGNLHTITLDRFDLNQGFMRYVPKSERVAMKLSAGGRSAIAAWLSSEKPAPGNPVPETPALAPR